MNNKWLKMVMTIFLSVVFLMGCNNNEGPTEDPANVNAPNNVNDADPDTVPPPVGDPADVVDPGAVVPDPTVPNTEDPVEDPADAVDPNQKE